MIGGERMASKGKELVLVLGGVRSGKSAFAQSLARRLGGRVTVVATARGADEEMRRRIEEHRRKRPAEWRTVEKPIGVGEAVGAEEGRAEVVLLDCLTMLVANAMAQPARDWRESEERVRKEVEELLKACEASSGTVIVVSNEVGMGVVPPYPVGRRYRDLLGWANQRLAGAADRVYWMAAGLAIEIKASGVAEAWEGSGGGD